LLRSILLNLSNSYGTRASSAGTSVRGTDILSFRNDPTLVGCRADEIIACYLLADVRPTDSCCCWPAPANRFELINVQIRKSYLALLFLPQTNCSVCQVPSSCDPNTMSLGSLHMSALHSRCGVSCIAGRSTGAVPVATPVFRLSCALGRSVVRSRQLATKVSQRCRVQARAAVSCLLVVENRESGTLR
jgi:hypothetical protein